MVIMNTLFDLGKGINKLSVGDRVMFVHLLDECTELHRKHDATLNNKVIQVAYNLNKYILAKPGEKLEYKYVGHPHDIPSLIPIIKTLYKYVCTDEEYRDIVKQVALTRKNIFNKSRSGRDI